MLRGRRFFFSHSSWDGRVRQLEGEMYEEWGLRLRANVKEEGKGGGGRRGSVSCLPNARLALASYISRATCVAVSVRL